MFFMNEEYALQYVLRKRGAVRSITWYKLGSNPANSVNQDRTERHWRTMRKWMGDDFDVLQEAVRAARLRDFAGEPDLFCWQPKTAHWFFAEAKRRDRIHAEQQQWFRLCERALCGRGTVYVFKLKPVGNADWQDSVKRSLL
jgi:hypothetical protein